MEKKTVLIRGGGDLASGVAVRLHQAGYGVVVTELPQPLVVRRKVSFAEAVYEGSCIVEGIKGRKADNPEQMMETLEKGEVAVLVDPSCECVEKLDPIAIVDGRLIKREMDDEFCGKWPVIGLGPGFIGGENCWVAIETNRGPELGKIFHKGSPEPDTGRPAKVMGYSLERVIYAHRDGQFKALVEIGDQVSAGQKVAEIDGEPVISQIKGAVHGLLRDGLKVKAGVKVGDIEPSGERELCFRVTDKALKIGSSVVEALQEIESRGRLENK